jgi:hypothetical protein
MIASSIGASPGAVSGSSAASSSGMSHSGSRVPCTNSVGTRGAEI